MPTIHIPIKNGYPADSVINMAETLGRLTKTTVQCTTILEVIASAEVITALKAIAPLAKAKRYKQRGKPDEPDQVESGSSLETELRTAS
jgi:hypothetical protein